MVKRKMFAAFNAGARDGEAPPRAPSFVEHWQIRSPESLLANSFVSVTGSQLAATGRGGGGGASLAREYPQVRAVRAPACRANAEPCVHAVGDGTVAHEDPAPDAQKLRRQTLSQNAVRRVQLVVVDHHRATAPSRVGEARGREDLARRYVVDVFAWQRHIRAKAVWEAKVGLSRRFLASLSPGAVPRFPQVARGGAKTPRPRQEGSAVRAPHDPQRGGERVRRVGGAGGGGARARGEGGSRYPKVGGEGAPRRAIHPRDGKTQAERRVHTAGRWNGRA